MLKLSRTVSDVLLALTVVLVGLFIVYPLGSMIAQAFISGSVVQTYADVLSANAHLIWNSATTGLLTGLISTVMSLAIALVIVFGARPLGKVLQGLAVMSIISPPFVASLAYIVLFGRRGLITHDLFGLDVSPYGMMGVVVMQSVFFAAINILMLTSVLERIDRKVLQAAQDLGAPLRSVLADIVFPLLRPSLLACVLLTFVRSISDYGTPVVIGGNFETVATAIYMQLVGYSDLAAASVLNVVLMLISIGVFFLYERMNRKTAALVGGTMGEARAAQGEQGFRLGGAWGAVVYAVAILYLLFTVVLYATIVRTAFSTGIGGSAKFTWAHLEHLSEFNVDSMWRSLAYALIAALISSIVGVIVAYFVHRKRVRGGALLDFAVAIPYMLPGTCIGLGYILAFNAAPLKLTSTATIVIAALVVKQLTISVQSLSSSMQQISPELDMAARDLGASEAGVLKDVLIPNVRSALVVSMVNSFSSAMVAYGAVIFLVSPGHRTAVFELFDALSGGKYNEAAMISLAIIVVTLGVNIALSDVIKRRKG